MLVLYCLTTLFMHSTRWNGYDQLMVRVIESVDHYPLLIKFIGILMRNKVEASLPAHDEP